MQLFDSATLTKLASGKIAKRDMLLFSFPSGLWGFWTGKGKLSFAGVDYVGAAGLIKMDALGSATGLASLAITATLTAIPNTDLTPDVLATIENENWHQTPVIISRAYIDPETRALLSVERMFRGYFDDLEHNEQIGGEYSLTAYFESKSRDHQKIGYRMRGDADQRLIDANDPSLSYVGIVGSQTISWGRIDAKFSTNAGGSGSVSFA